MIFALIIGIIIIIILLMLLCIMKKFKKFNFVKKIAGERKWLLRLICAVPVFIIIVFGYFDLVNTFITVLHLIMFWTLCDLIGLIINKLFHKEFKIYWQGALAMFITAVYLCIGWYYAHNVWQTNYNLKTTKDLGMDSLRIVQISDSHLGATFHWQGFAKHMKEIEKTNPDIIVVTGDYVDDDTTKEDMVKCTEILGQTKTTYGIYMIYGNHDKGYFNSRDFSVVDLEKELEKNNIILLEDEVKLIDDKFYLVGRQDRSMQNRMSADELTKDLDASKYIVMLDHQPNDYDNEEKTSTDLVLSGHSHGGQMFPIGITGELTGANDKTYGLEVRNDTTFIVNSGISDWAIKFKTATFSEYGVIDIKTK